MSHTLDYIDWDKVEDDLGIEVSSYCQGLMRIGDYDGAYEFLIESIEDTILMHYPYTKLYGGELEAYNL